eukprot:8812803-Heterocapsa_arctica.AAC.1
MKRRIRERLHHAATELKAIFAADCRAVRHDAHPAAWHVGTRAQRGGDRKVDAVRSTKAASRLTAAARAG